MTNIGVNHIYRFLLIEEETVEQFIEAEHNYGTHAHYAIFMEKYIIKG